MPDFTFTAAGGRPLTMATRDSGVLGGALEARSSFMVGTVFRPATASDRDALVAYLNALEYEPRHVEVVITYPSAGDVIYRIRAFRHESQPALERWIANEVREMARRLGLRDTSEIQVEVTEI